MTEIVDQTKPMTKKEIEQMELGHFIGKNSFIRIKLLSYFFHGRDYDLEYKYDRFKVGNNY